MDKNFRFYLSILGFTFNTTLIELLLRFIKPSKLATYIFWNTFIARLLHNNILEGFFPERFQFLISQKLLDFRRICDANHFLFTIM